MALISLRQLLDHAAENSYGVPAFNVNNMEQIQAIMRAHVLMQEIFFCVICLMLQWKCIRTFQFVFIRIMETILIHVSLRWLTNLPV